MGPQQAIPNPFGVTVFGSAVTRIAPDIASIQACVSAVEQRPRDAFAKAKQGARTVQEYLRTVPAADFGASRLALTQKTRFVDGASQFAGYEAKISFRVRLSELDHVDEIAEALVASGANQIESLTFETTRLRELRAETRRLAVAAAFDKARDYCQAAGVALGPVRHIEDVDPRAPAAHAVVPGGAAADHDSDDRALDASLIEVGAAVYLAFEIAADDGRPQPPASALTHS